MKRRVKISVLRCACAAALVLPAHPSGAQQRDMPIITVGGESVQRVNVPLNKGAIVNLPRDARDVMIAGPAIVDAVIRTPRQVWLNGLASGETSVYFLDESGNLILDLEVSVERDMGGLANMLARFVPTASITAEAVGDNIVLAGVAPSSAAAADALRIAERWAAAPENVISLVSVDGVEQVNLKVRVVEIQRTLLKQLGVNWNRTENFGDFDPAELASIQNRFDQNGNPVFEALEPGGFSDSVTIGTSNGFGVNGSQGGFAAGLDLTSVIGAGVTAEGGDVLESAFGVDLEALERAGLIRTLQEPNLTALSGEAANFFAGGEFPVPASIDENGNIGYEFRDFGVALAFTPTVLSGNRISMRISTEVSELSNQGALQVPGQLIRNADGEVVATTGGITIPALTVRRAESTVELSSGGAIVIAGLIADEVRQSIDGLPGIKDLPVLGALFRSTDFLSEQTELVVIATPYLVQQTNPDNLQTPADGLRIADGPESFLLGRLNSVYAAPGADSGGRTWQGPYGFITEPESTP
jgi:pilus assembly protein CpaC